METASPPVFKKSSGNPSGAIYGISQILNQSGVKRLECATPVKGLYIAGSDVFPGAGYQSVISSACKLSKYLLEKGLV
jgi:phytoene dehydrogenase-like protein